MIKILVAEKENNVNVSLCLNNSPYSIVTNNNKIDLKSGYNTLDDLPYGFYTDYINHSECIEMVDLSEYDTTDIINMSYMFSSCCNLMKLNLNKVNTSNVISMSGMFSLCCNLTKLDLSSFNTKNVKDVSFMFFHCSNLVELDIRNFDYKNITSLESMFSGCFNLSRIICNKEFKDWCLLNEVDTGLPSSMREGGNGVWDIID